MDAPSLTAVTDVLRWSASPSRSPVPSGPRRSADVFDDGALEIQQNLPSESHRGSSRRIFPFHAVHQRDDDYLHQPGPHESNSEILNAEDSHACIDNVTSVRVTSNRKAGSVYLTWEDLWVTVPNRRKNGSLDILQGMTGYAEPGRVLAIMGPSGCGKSTLLDALAGRLSSGTHQSGRIMVNGCKQQLSFGLSAYVTQDDVLMTTLTAREAIYYSAQLQLPDSMPISEKMERADATIRDMGLQDAMHTQIGGWGNKGLSGGQMRRVSICIQILTHPKLLFLDEPTSGLDSAASYHVMTRIVRLAQHNKRTVIVSLHQPSSEVFDLFHNLCLLSSGRTVYFGPISKANGFFASNGLPCPSMQSPSEHYLRTINQDFDLEEVPTIVVQDIEQGSHGLSAKDAIGILVKSYESSQLSEEVRLRVSNINEESERISEGRGGQAGFITQCLVLTRRSFVNMFRNWGYYWLRLVVYTVVCLCIGTIFYDIGQTYGSIQARGTMLMYVSTMLTFMTIGGFPSFVEDMKIFERERLNGHYSIGAFVISNSLSSMPFLFIIALIPSAASYFFVGLQRSFEHFAYFVLLIFVCMILVESLMMIVASIVPDFLMGIITGAGIQGIMMLNGGFFRLPNDLPRPIWRYPVYYIAFHKYANQGLYKNEFLGLNFPSELGGVGERTIISGEQVLRRLWDMEMGYSKWVDLGILSGMVILYRVMFFGIVKMKEKMK